MNQLFSINARMAKRIAYVTMATLTLLASTPFLQFGTAGATQFANRSIALSDSSPSGTSITTGVGSGTGVTYKVQFTPTHGASSMVIDFCSNDPIINDTCTAPTGMGTATGIANVAGTVGNSGWTLTASANQAKLARSAGTSADDIQATTTQTFTLTGVTNPSTTGTFYARMYTYANATWGTYDGPVQATGPPATVGAGNYVDYGGVALSTASVITITARVQETLSFCVTAKDPADATTPWTDCSDAPVAANPPALIIGHGSPTAILDTSKVDTGTVYSQISTNATTGAVIRMHNSNTSCGGLSADSGTTCAIPANNAGATTPSGMAPGTAAFGLFVTNGAVNVAGNGIGSTTADAAFHDATPASTHTSLAAGPGPSTIDDLWYGMTTDPTAGVTSTYGAPVVATTAPLYRVDNTYVFGATSALTTPAGIYTANLSMIATGTF